MNYIFYKWELEIMLWSTIVVTLCLNSCWSSLKRCAPVAVGVRSVMIVHNVGAFVDRFIHCFVVMKVIQVDQFVLDWSLFCWVIVKIHLGTRMPVVGRFWI